MRAPGMTMFRMPSWRHGAASRSSTGGFGEAELLEAGATAVFDGPVALKDAAGEGLLHQW